MIYGIGTDLCDVRRIAGVVQRQGERLALRILGEQENAMFLTRSQRLPARGLRYLATRFSAKEAFSKAIGLGIHHPMRWRDCELLNHSSGQPYLQLHGPLQQWCLERHLQFHVSVSDEGDYVSAFVVAEILVDSSASSSSMGL